MSPLSRNRPRQGKPTGWKKGSRRTLQRRQDAAVDAARNSTMLLFAVLAQKGGEVCLTQGTLDQARLNFGTLDAALEKQENGELILRLVTIEPAAAGSIMEATDEEAVVWLDGREVRHRRER